MWAATIRKPEYGGSPADYQIQKGATDQAVSNPFYGLLPPDKMPGTLATEETVPVSQCCGRIPSMET